jgi:putative acetyltransferase
MSNRFDDQLAHLQIREEGQRDVRAIRLLYESAFRRALEADVVESFRSASAATLSLLAEHEKQLLGHVVFCRAAIDTTAGAVNIAALGLMAVLPPYQGKKVGSRLLCEGLGRLRARGVEAVIALDRSRFCRRFGFLPASRFGLRMGLGPAEGDLVVAELRERGLVGRAGLVRYPSDLAPLARLTSWTWGC